MTSYNISLNAFNNKLAKTLHRICTMDDMRDFLHETQHELAQILKNAEKKITEETKRITANVLSDIEAIRKQSKKICEIKTGKLVKQNKRIIETELKSVKKFAEKELKKAGVLQKMKMVGLQKSTARSLEELYHLYLEEQTKTPTMIEEYILQPNAVMAEHLQNSMEFIKTKLDHLCAIVAHRVKTIFQEYYKMIQDILEHIQSSFALVFQLLLAIQALEPSSSFLSKFVSFFNKPLS